MSNKRGELALLELEEKALTAVEASWVEYQAEGKMGPPPVKLVQLIVEVHKMIMQRMNNKYALGGDKIDLENVKSALTKELELIDQMIEQEARGLQ